VRVVHLVVCCFPPLLRLQVEFMYDSGYVYHKSGDHAPGAKGQEAAVSRADMLRDVELSAQGWEVQAKTNTPRTFEGWWELAAGSSSQLPPPPATSSLRGP
jgi:hypothetical protein